MSLRNIFTRNPITFPVELTGRNNSVYTLLRYEDDGAGSGHVIAILQGRWGKANEEDFRPHFFGLEMS